MNRSRTIEKKLRRTLSLESLENRRVLASVSIIPSQDNSLFQENSGALSNGAGERLFIGRTLQGDTDLQLRRALIQFDIAGEVPAGATITSVSLQMEVTKSISDGHDADLHRVTSSWGESTSDANGQEGPGTAAAPGDATWLHREFSSVLWNTPGGDFVAESSGAASVARNGSYTWDESGMITDVQFWLDNPAENFGWIVIGNETVPGSAKRFDSRENSNEATRPQLTIEYNEGVGVTPDVSIADATAVVEGDTGTTTMEFTVTIAEAVTADATVDYATVAGTASAPDDYTATSGTLTFSANGPTSQTISVEILGDNVTEPDEQFSIQLSNASGLTLVDGEAVGEIQNDDDAPTISFVDRNWVEGDTGTSAFSLAVELSNPSSETVTVDYVTTAGTATADVDYTTGSGTLEFAPGETTDSVPIELLGDTDEEDDETFTVDFSNAQNGQLAAASATITITNDDSAIVLPNLSIADASVTEGDEGTMSLDFTVTLSETANEEVRVDFATIAGTASAPDDYTAINGTLVFAPGESTKTVNVAVVGDIVIEADENFVVELTNANGATIADGSATGTIQDDDDLPTISSADKSWLEGDEGATTFSVSVELSNPSTETVTVDYALVAGTATADEDFTAGSGQLEFAPGTTTASISVEFLGDTVEEGDETFTVDFSNAVNATLGTASVTVTITDDDGPIVDSPWQNTELPEDVTGDGLVVAIDALQVINELNGRGIGIGPGELPALGEFQPPPYLDVSGDGILSPIDALRVINYINLQSQTVAAVAAVAKLEVMAPTVEQPTVDSAAALRSSLVDLALADLLNDDEFKIGA